MARNELNLYKLTREQREYYLEFLNLLKKDGVEDIDHIINEVLDIQNYEDRLSAAQDATNRGETTIPEEKWWVHETHCCSKHACKYGNLDCPVTLGLIKQRYPCEFCGDPDFD